MAADGRRSSIGLQITCILAGRRINRDASSYTRNHCIQRQVDSAEEASSRSLPIDHRIFREIQPPCHPLPLYTCKSACPFIHIGTIATLFFHCSVLYTVFFSLADQCRKRTFRPSYARSIALFTARVHHAMKFVEERRRDKERRCAVKLILPIPRPTL